MLKRLIYAVVGVVGLALIGLAIASATVWRADDVLRASATADQAIVVTDPGVLQMAGDPVTVTATVPDGGRVVLAIGRDTDVDGWVGTDAHQRVSGLASWHALALATAGVPTSTSTGESTTPSPDEAATASPSARSDEATEATAAVPDAEASDMWVAQAEGEGSAELTWQAQPGRWSLLAVGSAADGSAAPPTLELAWPRTVTTPYLVPGSVVGALLALLALLQLGRDVRRSHRGPAEWTPVLTEPVPVLTSTGAQPALTRRQLREMRALAEAGHRIEVPAEADEPAVEAGQVATATAAAAGPADEGGQASLLGRRSLRRRQTAAEPGTREADTTEADTTASPRPVPEDPARIAPAEPVTGEWPVVAGQPATVGADSGLADARPAWAPGRRAEAAGSRVAAGVVDAVPPRAPAFPVAAAPDAGSAPAPVAPSSPVAAGRGGEAPDEAAHQPAWLRAASDQVRRRDARGRQTPAWAPGASTPPAGESVPESWGSPQAPGLDRVAPEPSAPEPPAPDQTAGEQPEASRADAWRRAWGLPSLGAEEGEK